MVTYTIRADLQGNPAYQRYEDLHQWMANLGFHRTAQGSNTSGQSVIFNLPTDIYYGFSNQTVSQASDSALNAASRIAPVEVVFSANALTWWTILYSSVTFVDIPLMKSGGGVERNVLAW